MSISENTHPESRRTGRVLTSMSVVVTLLAGTVACSSSKPSSSTRTEATETSSLSATTDGSAPTTAVDATATTGQLAVAGNHDAVMSGFVAAGIVVTPNDTFLDDPTGIVYPQFQADSLAIAAENHIGVTGSWLRTNFALPDDVTPIDTLIFAWMLAGPSPAAEAARGLVGVTVDTDTSTLVLPWAVIAMFINDVIGGTVVIPTDGPSRQVHPQPSDATGHAGGRPVPAGHRSDTAGLGGLCEKAQAGYEKAANAVNQAIDDNAGLFDGLVKWVQGGIRVPGKGDEPFQFNPGKIISELGKKALRTVANGLAAVALVAQAFEQWIVIIQPDDAHLGTTVKAGESGTFIARLLLAGEDWPDYVKACAKFTGVTLPKITPVDSPVHWTPIGDVATLASTETAIVKDDLGYSSTVGFTALPDTVEGTEKRIDPFTVKAVVERTSKDAIEAVSKLILDVVLGALPDVVKSLIVGVVGDVGSKVIDVTDAENTSIQINVEHAIPDDSVPLTEPADGATTVPVTDPPEPFESCVGHVLTSHTVTSKAAGDGQSQVEFSGAAGVALILNPDGTGSYDFDPSTPSTGTIPDVGGGPAAISVKVNGRMTFSWTASGAKITTALTSGNITTDISVTIGGQTTQANSDSIPLYSDTDYVGGEPLTCNSGVVILPRTGQVYT